MKITKFGHCCLLLETDGARLLTDPGSFTTEQNSATDIDAVLITHEHGDHFHVESVKAILANNPSIRIITNSSVGKLLDKENIPYENVGDGEKTQVNEVTIEGMGSKHAEIFREIGQVENTGYFLTMADQKFFYPGDSFYEPGREVDILALPVAGPWMALREAIYYALGVKPTKAFPVHDAILSNFGGFVHTMLQNILGKEGIEFVSMKAGDTKEF